jgi:hypothetical protein
LTGRSQVRGREPIGTLRSMEVCPAFIDETGILGDSANKQPTYGVGVLIVPEPPSVTDPFYRLHFNFVSDRATARKLLVREIRASGRALSLDEFNLLQRDTRHHEYKFSEVTRGNVDQYLALLRLYFEYSRFEFHGLLVDRHDERFNLGLWDGDQWRGYVELVAELIRRRLRRDVFAIVDLQGAPTASHQELEDALCVLPGVKGCLRASSETSVFLQLVDVLLGCLQFDWNDAHRRYLDGSGRAAAKRRLVHFVKARLGVPADQPMLTETNHYRRWSKSSTYSATLWQPPESKRKRAVMSGATPANGTR